ncbi:hypothetical protein GPX89_04695 [Nocardia sp. ET3-3]|uniref:Uncharacterized protein n=1 Tax=Nocardia terrae TaxID=2675851 RepID=A0A7K1UQB9_9NOCA|nr:hypothetical protein [Nocardia terrae]MVU76540.1 hypothetical protein [Nocardia terrae]
MSAWSVYSQVTGKRWLTCDGTDWLADSLTTALLGRSTAAFRTPPRGAELDDTQPYESRLLIAAMDVIPAPIAVGHTPPGRGPK